MMCYCGLYPIPDSVASLWSLETVKVGNFAPETGKHSKSGFDSCFVDSLLMKVRDKILMQIKLKSVYSCYLVNSTRIKKILACLAQLVKHATVNLEVMASSPLLGVEITFKKLRKYSSSI